MSRIFRTIAPQSKRRLSFVGRAASRILNTLQITVRGTDTQSVASEPESGEETEETIYPLSDDQSSSDHVSEYSGSDVESSELQSSDTNNEDSTDEDGSDVGEYATSESVVSEDTNATQTSTAVNAETEPTQTFPLGTSLIISTFEGTTPSDRVLTGRFDAPVGYTTAPDAAGPLGTQGDQEVTVHTRREFLYLPSLAIDRETTHSRASERQLFEEPFAEDPLRWCGRKRGREDDKDSVEEGPSTEAEERPRIRRRCSAPRPRCTRETCLALHLPPPDRTPNSDDEDTWSSAAQASETEPDIEIDMMDDDFSVVGPPVTRVARPGRRPHQKADKGKGRGSPSRR
ncbi:hypothetical protein BN946_scf185016.g29 [Trametes cinnabarina]|uniref:Uncharacterized protein n=1 Tax=Pycnoporus cinnabarinus TaxID=5643 RepID=A0A060SHA4_PYCCI|nr:hypothetical protein BN946_scf185016.g29 [Trametes cinnabarina]